MGNDVVVVAVAVDFAVDAGSVVVSSCHHSPFLLPLFFLASPLWFSWRHAFRVTECPGLDAVTIDPFICVTSYGLGS